MSYSNVFGGTPLNSAQSTYLALALSANTSLYWPVDNATSTNVVADIIDVTPSAGSLVVTMPSALQGSKGVATIISNQSGSYAFSVNNAGGVQILSCAVGTVWILYLVDNSTANGSWHAYQLGAQAGSINVAAIAGAGIVALGATLNQSMPIATKSSNYTATINDRANAIVWTGGAGTITLPSASAAGSNWFVNIRNSGTGDVTVSPPSGTIDGAASKVFSSGVSSASVFTDGTNYYTLGFGGSGAASGFDYTTINIAGTGDYTITGGQLNRISYLLTGALTGNRNLIVPAAVQEYWINNGTSGAFTLTVKTASGTGIAVAQGQQAILYCDGTNVVSGVSAVALPLTITNGGTGASSAAAALANLGGTSVGINVFEASSGVAAFQAMGFSDVNGSITFAPTLGVGLLINAVSGTSGLQISGAAGSRASLTLVDGRTGTRSWSIMNGSSAFLPGYLSFYDAFAATHRLFIDTSGQVNISTPDAGFGLIVNNGPGGSIAIEGGATYKDAVMEIDTYTGKIWRIKAVDSDSSWQLYDGSRSAAVLTASTTGTVTISAPSGGNALTAVGTVAASAGQFDNGGVNGAGTGLVLGGLGSWYGRVVETSTDTWTLGKAATRTGAVTPILQWTQAGNVTINAPSSGTAFSISAVSGSAGLVVTDPTVSTSSSVLFAGPSKGIRFGHTASLSSIDGVDQTGSGSYQPLQITGSVLNLGVGGATYLGIGGSGNVTINAPSSGTALVVNQASTSTGISVVSAGVGGIGLSISGAGTNSFSINLNSTGGDYYLGVSNSAGSGFLSGVGAYGLNLQSVSARSIGFGTNNALRMLIDGTNGNVTINAPSSGTTLALTGSTSTNALTMSDGTETAYFNTDGSHGWRLGVNGSNSLTLFTNNTNRLGIASGGGVTVGPTVAITAGGVATAGVMFTSTANFGVFTGSGAPTMSAAKGSLYLRSDGSTTNNRAYINTDGSTTWTALTTAA